MAIQFNTFFQYEYLSLIIGVASPLPHIHQSLFHLLIFLSFLNMNNEVKMMVGHDFHLTQQDFPLMWKNGVKMMVGNSWWAMIFISPSKQVREQIMVGHDFTLIREDGVKMMVGHDFISPSKQGWGKSSPTTRLASETRPARKYGLQSLKRN